MSDDTDDLGDRLRRIGFRARKDALDAFLQHAHKSRVGPTETVEQLVDLEERSRAAVNLARRTRFACLGSFKTMDRFDWAHPEKIDRALVERLLELDFAEHGENVLLKGGSGLGKTMIALNLAHAALAAGFTVRFSTLAAALADLLNQESMPAFERRIRRYTRPDVLILDELGYLPLTREEASLFFRLLVRRYERASLIVTSNKSFVDWGEVFNDQILATAILDRLLHHATTVNIKGDSYRLREKKKAGLLGRKPKLAEEPEEVGVDA